MVLVYSDGSNKAIFNCIMRDRWKIEKPFRSLKTP